MLKKWLIAFSIIISSISCIDEVDPVSGNFEEVLVVDGIINNGYGPFYIKLSYTTTDINIPANPIFPANVSIEDDIGNQTQLQTNKNGFFETPHSFYGEIGRSYKLKIRNTLTNEFYESAYCLLHEPSFIDSINVSPTEIIDPITNDKYKGISLLANARACEDQDIYLRWNIKEDWKFALPTPRMMEMINDNDAIFLEDPEIYCFSNANPKIIQLHSFKNQTNKEIQSKEIYTIPTDTSYRFNNRYRAIIEQYSISEEEYLFWNKLKNSTQVGNDLFGRQPFTLNSNIECTSNPSKKVLGYFQVAGKTTDTIYINKKDILNLGLRYQGFKRCTMDTLFNKENTPIYAHYLSRIKTRSFFLPVYDSLGNLLYLVFSEYRCSKCNLNRASRYPPTNWRDN